MSLRSRLERLLKSVPQSKITVWDWLASPTEVSVDDLSPKDRELAERFLSGDDPEADPIEAAVDALSQPTI